MSGSFGGPRPLYSASHSDVFISSSAAVNIVLYPFLAELQMGLSLLISIYHTVAGGIVAGESEGMAVEHGRFVWPFRQRAMKRARHHSAAKDDEH